MSFDLERIFVLKTDEEEDKWNEYIDGLVKKYNLCTEVREIDGHQMELWCYDEDLATLFYDFGIGVGRSFDVEKVFDFDDYYNPVGLDYGDYIEKVELHQNGKTYIVHTYCAYNGCGADYAFAIFELEKKGE